MQTMGKSTGEGVTAACWQCSHAAAFALVAVTAVLIAGCASQSATQAAAKPAAETVWTPVTTSRPAPPVWQSPATEEQNAVLRKDWGIEIYSLRMNEAGYLVDFRYRVLDPVKAATLGARENRPYLVDEASGKTLTVPTTPKLGPLRQSARQLKTGRVYFVLFANPLKIVKSGSKVTIVIGDFRVENLAVQ